MPNTDVIFEYTYAAHDVDSGGSHVWAGVCGQPARLFQLDTGSSGMIVGQNALSKVDLSTYPCFGPGQMHYFSSNNVRSGTWYYLPVTLIADAKGKPAGATIDSYAMVLVVNDPPDFDGGMMGVSARGQFAPYNALFNATQSNSGSSVPLVQSYVLTQQAVVIGANYNNPGPGTYTFVKLQQPSTPPTPPKQVSGSPTVQFATTGSWTLPAAQVTIRPASGAATNFSAAFLMDTGISSMLITAPASDIPAGVLEGAQSPGGAAAQSKSSTTAGPPSNPQSLFIPNIGTTIHVELTNSGSAELLNYTFLIEQPQADQPPETPAGVIYMGAPGANDNNLAGINVGAHPLRNHVYIFDAANGYIGFSPR